MSDFFWPHGLQRARLPCPSPANIIDNEKRLKRFSSKIRGNTRVIKPVNLRGNQPWIFIGTTEVETPIFWSSNVNSWLTGKVPGTKKDWGQKNRKRASEDEMAGWHHRCNGHELGQTSGDDEGQGGLACCSPWGRKELNTTGWLNNNKKQLMGLCDRALYDLWNLEYFLSGIFQKSFANIWCK